MSKLHATTDCTGNLIDLDEYETGCAADGQYGETVCMDSDYNAVEAQTTTQMTISNKTDSKNSVYSVDMISIFVIIIVTFF